MKKVKLVLALLAAVWSVPSLALLTGASPTPSSRTLNTLNNNAIPVTWSVSADSAHVDGANSSPAQLRNVATSAVLGTIGASFSQAGAGPFSFSETLNISAAQVTNWQTQGIAQVEVFRLFADVAGRSVAASVLLSVPARGNITSASVSPLQSQLNATTNNSLPLTWRVNATATYTSGVTSSPASLINNGNGSSLGSAGGALNGSGAAPYNLSENLVLSAAQVQGWQLQGIAQVRVERTFTDTGSGDTQVANHVLVVPPRGNLTSARVSPTQRQVYASQDNDLQLNWQVAAGVGHVNGVISLPARVLDPRTGSAFASLGATLSASGAGPFIFSERLTLDAATAQAIAARKLQTVVLERTFSDPVGGGSTKAHMVLNVSGSPLDASRGSAPGALAVQGLRLEFDTGNDLTLTEINSQLKAQLTLAYTGSGLLEGRWQLAEPGSSEGLPLYRTLALVRQNLVSNQRVILASPKLPTLRAGKYLLRFCVTNRDLIRSDTVLDPQCPIEELVIDAAYQVQGVEGVPAVVITGLSPHQQAATAKTPFSWPPVAGAQVYQMQVFALQASGLKSPSSRQAGEVVEPSFVVGMVLPAATTKTPLSELVRSKLNPGSRYLWRITAHDPVGRLIGSSGEYTFIYQPEE